MENRLDITALKKAAAAFDNALAFALKVESKPVGKLEFFELESARASVIQHFEFCYELCWKTMKRFIEMDIGSDADILTRKDIFRISAEKRLVVDFGRWILFNGARNRTSHVYNEDSAVEIYQIAKSFNMDLKAFVKTMEQRI
ncbi:MAG: nucleotidyltransferase substrate binding protein [Holophagales bacterium]|jgi:nucleotidyltransferase substrate binding protein (TIGR01987 family)|nr:nucleotidyltransferase substrate binding protein [Holophagales bacterium]